MGELKDLTENHITQDFSTLLCILTPGLHKYDHVSHYRLVIGWLPVSSVILHHSLVTMYMQYKCNHCLLLNLQINFGWHISYHTRTTPASFANIFRYKLSFSKTFCWSKITNWWNDLPITLISSPTTKFSHELYNYLLYNDCLYNFVMLFVFVYCMCCI